MKKVKEKFRKIKESRLKYKLSVPGPIQVGEMETFKTRFKSIYNVEANDQFLEFLTICNGLEENSFLIYSAGNESDIFTMNEFWKGVKGFSKSIVFGDADVYVFVYNRQSEKFQVLGRDSGDIIESFNTMEKLLEYILDSMLD